MVNIMQKWRDLFAQLEVIDYGQETFSEEQLIVIEVAEGIILPAEYKKFCQVFGTGMFGEFIGISCPTSYWLEASRQHLENIRYELTQFPSEEHGKNIDINTILKLLDSAFVFGDDSGAYIALWDLRTYSEVDQSYDIYWTNSDCFNGDIYLVGRTFYEFVKDFCLGTRAFEILPESMHPIPETIYQSFTSSSSPKFQGEI